MEAVKQSIQFPQHCIKDVIFSRCRAKAQWSRSSSKGASLHLHFTLSESRVLCEKYM